MSENHKDTPPSDKDTIKTDSTLEEAFQDINSTMPDVSDHVVKLSQEEAAQDAGGQPEAEAPKPRGRGRPPKNQANPTQPKVSRIGKQPTMEELQRQNANLIAMEEKRRLAVAVNAATHLVQVSGFMVAGSDAAYKPEEKLAIEGAFEQYFVAKGMIDFPPGIALAFGLLGYYARIGTTPPARSKLKLASAWVKDKFSTLFRRNKNAAYPYRGNDNERENNASEETR